MLVALILGALVVALWAAGTMLALCARRGRRFGGRGARLPLSTRLLWCCCPLLLAIAADAFYDHSHNPARLATAVVVAVVSMGLTMLVPILVHNVRLK